MSDDEKPRAKFIRLQNGDDVIAQVVETEDEHGILYTLFHPLKLVYMPTETTGYVSIAFMPWVFPRICDEQTFCLHAEDVLIITEVAEKMNIYYWESVDSYLNISSKIEEQMETSEQEELSTEEEELYNNIIDKLGIKRTFH